MKKTFLSLGLGLAVASAAFASVLDLNTEIARLLQPFQNEKTVAALSFQDIRTDEVRTLALALNGLYRKVGSQNRLEIRLDDVSYNYGDGTAPVTKINAGIGIDLSKIMPQKQINELIPGVEEMVQGLAKEATREYGDAVTVVAQVLEKTQDDAGNYLSIRAKIGAVIDLSKLPEAKPSEDVLFTSAEAELVVSVKDGLSVNAVIVSNPAYKGFRRDQKGLKESLEQLLARDPKQMAEIEKIFKSIDGFAARIVEGAQE